MKCTPWRPQSFCGLLASIMLMWQIGLSPIVGYLAAGVLIGPHALALIRESETTHLLAERRRFDGPPRIGEGTDADHARPLLNPQLLHPGGHRRGQDTVRRSRDAARRQSKRSVGDRSAASGVRFRRVDEAEIQVSMQCSTSRFASERNAAISIGTTPSTRKTPSAPMRTHSMTWNGPLIK